MPEGLLDIVRRELLPALGPLGFEVVESEAADVFDNATVTLQGPDLRVRIVRERSEVFADFGPRAEPGTWFDSAVLFDYLCLSSQAGFHDRDVSGVLRGIAAFVRSFHGELARAFQPSSLAITKQAIEALKERRAQKLFGG